MAVDCRVTQAIVGSLARSLSELEALEGSEEGRTMICLVLTGSLKQPCGEQTVRGRVGAGPGRRLLQWSRHGALDKDGDQYILKVKTMGLPGGLAAGCERERCHGQVPVCSLGPGKVEMGKWWRGFWMCSDATQTSKWKLEPH